MLFGAKYFLVLIQKFRFNSFSQNFIIRVNKLFMGRQYSIGGEIVARHRPKLEKSIYQLKLITISLQQQTENSTSHSSCFANVGK